MNHRDGTLDHCKLNAPLFLTQVSRKTYKRLATPQGMTWIHAASDRNGLVLTDGYIKPHSNPNDTTKLAAHEHAFAAHHCRIANKAVRNYRKKLNMDGHSVQTWVLGRKGWLNSDLPDLVRNVAGEGEDAEAYRMVMVQFDRSMLNIKRHARAGRWLYGTGMFGRKNHVADQVYRTAASDLLNQLLPTIDSGNGSEFLDKIHVPYTLGRFARA